MAEKQGWKSDGKLIHHFYKNGYIKKSLIIVEGSNQVIIMSDKKTQRTAPAPSFDKANDFVKKYIKNHPRG